MSVWEKLQHNLNPKPVIKEAKFKYLSTLFAKEFIKTAASFGVSEDEAISQLANLDNAYERNNK